MKAPNPFDLGQLTRPSFSKKDAWHVGELKNSEAWEIVQRVWDWQANALNFTFINSADESNFAFYQGLLKGFALARRIIDDLSRYSSDEEDMSKVEDAFYNKWGHDPTTGY